MGLSEWLGLKQPRDAFAQLVARKLAEAGKPNGVYDAAEFRLTFDGGEQMFLHNHYAEHCAAPPWRRAALIRQVVASAIELVVSAIPDDLIKARMHLMPVLRDPVAFESVRLLADKSPDLAARPFAEDYTLALAFDTPRSMAFLNNEQLAKWGITYDRAMEYAIENLGKVPPRFEEISRGLFASRWKDNYDATRVLLTGMIRGLGVKGRPVAGVPHRDLLLVAGEDDPAAVARLVAETEKEMAKPRTIGGVPLVLDGETWRPYVPTGDAAPAPQVRGLVTRARGSTYAMQKRLLEEAFQKRGTELFVASVSGFAPEGGGELTTYSVWSRGVPTLLPRTDLIALVDPEITTGEPALGLFPWERVVEIAGDLMKPEGLQPERWRLDAFPDAAALARLAPYRR